MVTTTIWELSALLFMCFALGVASVFAVMSMIPDDWLDDNDDDKGAAA